MGKRPAPRRQPAPYEGEEPRPGFSLGALTNLGAIPILTAIFTVGGFYYITNSTLTRHTADIDQIKVEVKKGNEDDTAARAKIRDEFLAAQMKTSDGIGKLDTRLAVAETNQKIANDTLSKIADTLTKITTMPPRH